jgi:hypothetical protein
MTGIASRTVFVRALTLLLTVACAATAVGQPAVRAILQPIGDRKLQREVIDRGMFTSVADLKRTILRYIRLYQKTAKPFRWKYSDVTKRIPSWQRLLGDSPLVTLL